MRHGKHPRTHSGVEHCGQDASLHKTARSTEFFLAVEASPYPPSFGRAAIDASQASL